MNRLFVLGLLVFGIYYMGLGGAGIFSKLKNGSAALIAGMSEQDLNTHILEYYKETVLGGVNEFTPDAINTTITDLNDDGKKDVIAIPESSLTCGSGGCIASIFIVNDIGELTAIPFDFAVRRIEVLGTLTRGMHDLQVNEDTTHRMVWDGKEYVLEQM